MIQGVILIEGSAKNQKDVLSCIIFLEEQQFCEGKYMSELQ